MQPELLDIVEVLVDFPEHHIPAGTQGTIVHCYPGNAFEVEFVNEEGGTTALFSMLAAVLDFADTCSPGDDLTLLVIRRREAIKSEQPRSRAKDSSAIGRRPASVTRTKKSAAGDKVSNS